MGEKNGAKKEMQRGWRIWHHRRGVMALARVNRLSKLYLLTSTVNAYLLTSTVKALLVVSNLI